MPKTKWDIAEDLPRLISFIKVVEYNYEFALMSAN